MPDTIQVLRVELPAGNHRVTLQVARDAEVLGPPAVTNIQIEDGRNTYALANFPRTQLAGQIVVKNPSAMGIPAPCTYGGRGGRWQPAGR